VRALMLHGAGGGAWEWSIWRRVFEANGVCVDAFDLQPADSLNETRYAHYLLQVCRQIERSRPSVLVGASLGGLLAAEAMSEPAGMQTVRALILAAPIPKMGLHRVEAGWVKQWAHTHQLHKTARAIPDCDAASIQFAHARWRDESTAVLNCAYAGRTFAATRCPTLMLIAEQDQDIPESSLRHWASADGMDIHRVHGASHAGVLLGGMSAQAAEFAQHWARLVLRQ
jgi:pimeloyl-ACP methyl ester carboxylesterase